MKTLMTTMIIATAAMTIAAGAASAQTLKADVPFAFHSGGKVMDAGSYRVSLDRAQRFVTIQSAKDGPI